MMDVSHLLDALNPAQREAVAAPQGHYLVLAGAGTGFVLHPDFKRFTVSMVRDNGVNPGGKVFLKLSCAATSLSG